MPTVINGDEVILLGQLHVRGHELHVGRRRPSMQEQQHRRVGAAGEVRAHEHLAPTGDEDDATGRDVSRRDGGHATTLALASSQLARRVSANMAHALGRLALPPAR